ncbi:hypothetical protein SAMD00019534_086880, partial [Acytostelium subglobosum LB1]|uniref:hypothetical protein n=1 Tax=Acytostelium subglobosum LB1 TaxID=1410327 RepID=UPI000644EAA9
SSKPRMMASPPFGNQTVQSQVEDSSPIDQLGNILYNPDYTHYVVHSQKSDYDMYIGRRNPLIDSRFSDKWGNPFKVGVHGNRNECMKKYRDWIFSPEQDALFKLAKKELKGKILACWCAPLNCHGYVLAEIANSSIGNSKVDQPQQQQLVDNSITSTTSTQTQQPPVAKDVTPANPNSWAALIKKQPVPSSKPSTFDNGGSSSVEPTKVSKPSNDSLDDFPALGGGLKKK